jgi:hypothetical protein
MVEYRRPSKKTVDFLYKGIVAFYPRVAIKAFGLSAEEFEVKTSWGGYGEPDFNKLLLNTAYPARTVEEAALVVKRWEEGGGVDRTIPENLDELVAQLDEKVEQKAAAYETQALAKKTLLESQQAVESLAPVPTETPAAVPAGPEPTEVGIRITPQAGMFLQKSVNRIVAAPIRAAVFWASPSLANVQGGVPAASMNLWARGIIGAKLEGAAQEIPSKEAKRVSDLIKAIKGIESGYSWQTRLLQRSYPVKEITLLLRPETGLTQAQVSLFFNPVEQGGVYVAPRRGFMGNIFSGIGQQLFGNLSKKVVKGLLSKAGSGLAGAAAETGAVAAGAEVGAVAGGPAAPITAVIGAIVGWIASKVPEILSWMQRHAKEFGMAAAALLFSGALLGNPFLLFSGLGLGALSLGAGGLSGIGSGITGFGQGLVGGITNIVLPTIGLPVLISLVSLPILIAIILFIINSGAYLVPPRVSLLSGGIESPYIDVKKTATPDCLNRSGCPGLPGEIVYEVEISAKKGALTNIKIDNAYQVFGKGSGRIDAPEIPVPEIISPVASYIFSYQVNMGTSLDDSVVYDTLTVTANAPGQDGAVASSVASVIIGEPPASSCPIIGGAVSTGSYNGQSEVGHGSNPYWSGPAGTDCGYDIPAFSGCSGPTSSADPDNNNVCRNQGGLCSYYGYAADVRRSGVGDVVQLPAVFGRTINWTFQRRVSIARGSWGYGYVFTGNDGRSNYSLYLGHINQVNPPSTLPSGTVLGTLYPNLTPPHVHIELQINGQWVRPDFLCGGQGP